jgi:hypothetical protein
MLAGLLALCSGIDDVTLPVRLSASERLRQAGGGKRVRVVRPGRP